MAGALADFIAKYNERNPGKEVLYFNYAAVDPILTNEKCSFSHFRWDANSDIKMQALTSYMKDKKDIKKVYLINQDYSFGESVRTTARAMLKQKRPDIEIVGDEKHPLLKITDFAPYIAKIKASGADTVITGNWGQDFALLLKAAADAGLKAGWYTYYAGGAGGPTAIKQAGLNDQVFQVSEGYANIDPKASLEFEKAFPAKYNGQTSGIARGPTKSACSRRRRKKAKSIDPSRSARRSKAGISRSSTAARASWRKDDHQFFQPIYISQFGELKSKEPFDEEKTGWGWKGVAKIDTGPDGAPTTCKMTLP